MSSILYTLYSTATTVRSAFKEEYFEKIESRHGKYVVVTAIEVSPSKEIEFIVEEVALPPTRVYR